METVSGSESWSVIVIGAGITGTSAAHFLAEQGGSVAVIDSGGIGGQSSTQTAGNLHYQLSYHAMKGTDEEFAQHTRILELNNHADATWSEFGTRFEGAIDISQHGGIVVAENERDLDALRRKVDLERQAGFKTQFADGVELRERVPELSTEVLGGSWHPDEGHVNARTVCYELARSAAQRGAEFFLDTHVVGLERHGRRWRVDTAGGKEFLADEIVISAGPWTRAVVGMAGYDLPLDVHGLNVSITERCNPKMTNLVMHASRPLSIKQMNDGNVMVGGGRPASLHRTSEPLGFATKPRSSSVMAGIDDAVRVIPALAGLRLIRAWQGLLATPIDELPIIGALPGAQGAYIAVAGHTGFTLAPSIGRLVAQMVAGAPLDVSVEAFSPSRFSSIQQQPSGKRCRYEKGGP